MAAGALRAFGADIAVSTTGIAGPDGGTSEKPVGYVCFGLATADGVVTRTHQLWGTRDWVKLLASQVALDMVRRTTLGLQLWDPSLFRRR
jgi:nicotinamide-nucleotide amidase